MAWHTTERPHTDVWANHGDVETDKHWRLFKGRSAGRQAHMAVVVIKK